MSEELEGDCGAGFGVGKGVMVILHIVAACGRREVELMARDPEAPARCGESAVEFIAGIIHAIFLKHGFQAALVKWTVVGHKRKIPDFVGDAGPHLGKRGLTVSVAPREPVDGRGPIRIVVRYGLNQTIEFINNFASAHNHNAHTANRRTLPVGSFKVNSCKVFHSQVAGLKNGGEPFEYHFVDVLTHGWCRQYQIVHPPGNLHLGYITAKSAPYGG